MIFSIDFNRGGDDKVLKQLGATELWNDGEFITYELEINSLEELERLQERVNTLMNTAPYEYSLIIDFTNPRAIFFDKET